MGGQRPTKARSVPVRTHTGTTSKPTPGRWATGLSTSQLHAGQAFAPGAELGPGRFNRTAHVTCVLSPTLTRLRGADELPRGGQGCKP